MGFIAVHCGAGNHKLERYPLYKKLCKKACISGMKIIKSGGTAVEACRKAIMVLENDPITNAGFGSTLNSAGQVECDASIMDGKNLHFGGCGAVKQVHNPITLAYHICESRSKEQLLDLQPPFILTGDGAEKYAQSVGMKLVNNETLISKKARKRYQKYSSLKAAVSVLDTVGAVCLDKKGNVAAACSSGGIALKHPGRVGQAALFGCGTWADNYTDSKVSVAATTSGCGEYLIQTQLARQIGTDVQKSQWPASDLLRSFQSKFLDSPFLRNAGEKLGGVLLLHCQDNKVGDLLWAHSTQSMIIGYMAETDRTAQAAISVLSDRLKPGQDVVVECKPFSIT